MNEQQIAHTAVSLQAQYAIQVLEHATIANELMLKKGVSSRRFQSSSSVLQRLALRFSTSQTSVPISKGGSSVSEGNVQGFNSEVE